MSNCDTACDLWNSAVPLRLALSNPDSANVPVPLATATLSGAAGDSLQLSLAAPAALIDNIAAAETLYVTRDGERLTLTLYELLVPKTIYRFSSDGDVALDFALSRHVTASTDEMTRLVLHRSPSTTPKALWRPFADETAGSVHTLGGMPMVTHLNSLESQSCAVVAPSPPPCGTTVITLNPNAGGGPFGGFQYAPGTGIMHPVTVTFSQAVASVAVTVLDPTFVGNRVTAFDASSGVVEAFDYQGSGVPGVFTAPSHTFSGAIQSLLLTPAPLDYVAYRMLVTTGGSADQAIVSCTPVQRGQTIRCTVSVLSGRAFHVSSLTATADTSRKVIDIPIAFPEVAAGASFPFGGVAVVSTDVTAVVDVETAPGQLFRLPSATSTFTVQPRTFMMSRPLPAGFRVGTPDELRYLFQNMYLASAQRRVAAMATLLHTPSLSDYPVTVVSAGPNRGFAFLSAPPALPQTEIWVNPFFDTSSEWARDQDGGSYRDSSGVLHPFCTQADYVHLRELAFIHEGLPPVQVDSHVGIDRDQLPSLAPRLEGIRFFSSDATSAANGALGRAVGTFDNWDRLTAQPLHERLDSLDATRIWVSSFSCTWDFNRTAY